MKNKNKVTYFITMLFLAVPIILFVSCGSDSANSDVVYAPWGSKIVMSPDTSGPISMPTGTLRLYATVYVEYLEGTKLMPLNGVGVHISGGFAFPFDPSLYQIRDAKTDAVLASPFIAKTGDYGTYRFYLEIPALINYPAPGTLNSFVDTVYVSSGLADPATLEINFN